MSEPVFIMALTIAATTMVLVAKAIAGAVAGRGGSRSELAQIKQRLEQHAAKNLRPHQFAQGRPRQTSRPMAR